jgi:hypothetical protein
MVCKLKRPQLSDQNGVVLIEFAVLIPFFLLLLAGITEIGYLYFHLNTLNKSVQDAGRYFSNPMISRKLITSVIDTSDTTTITPTKNVLVYGREDTGAVNAANCNPTSSTGLTNCPLLPNGDCMINNTNGCSITIACINDVAGTVQSPCTTTANHIRVTAVYAHSYLFRDLLRTLCRNCLPSTTYPLRASAVFRVRGGE